MSTETRTNFLGIPVEGSICPGEKATPQRPLSELEPLIRAVVDDEGMASFGWTQYTPYFNDGDPCTFSVGELWFRTAEDAKAAGPEVDDDEGDDDEDEDEEDNYRFEISGHPTLATRRWDSATCDYVPVERDAETEARYQRCKDLAHAIGSGAFDDVLLEAFGDHCQVTVRRDGITVDEYSHD